ncbi:hypothetical protein [Stutzerimonas stutzeri]|uniref:hypothetical protein n=1 Tax=Stutzerimonas stutzeri TaxID=316 RepID=UPI0002EE1028|nr:hypothetical protein [Stutzerimonas stutzeri]
MNTTTAAHCFQTISALSLALLIGGTAGAHQRLISSSEDGHLHEYDHAVQSKTGCANGWRATLFNLGAHSHGPQCAGASSADTSVPAPIRLAKPLSGNPYRSGESIRYSF